VATTLGNNGKKLGVFHWRYKCFRSVTHQRGVLFQPNAFSMGYVIFPKERCFVFVKGRGRFRKGMDCNDPFSDWFGTKWNFVWCQINRKSVIAIQEIEKSYHQPRLEKLQRAVRETGTSRHQGGSIESSLFPPLSTREVHAQGWWGGSTPCAPGNHK